MYTKVNPRLITSPASLVIVGEISHTLRAQGKTCASGTVPDDSEASPVVEGVYKEIPQVQVGFMDYGSFTILTDNFIDMSGNRDPWNIVSANSMDAIFCPYNTFMDSGRVGPYMPYWTAPASDNSIGNSKTLNPFNPFNKIENVNPNGYELSEDPWMESGHNLSMALYYNPLDSGVDGGSGYVGVSGVYPSGNGSPIDFYFEKDHWARHTVETSGIRAVGFKAPMVLTGWGYDLNGNPVPSDSGDVTKFHPESSWNLHLWKSGPVDLRWDESRGVWTGGNTTKIYLVKLTNLYTPPSFSFEVDRSNSRDQYTRNAPNIPGSYEPTGNIYDPEYVAYTDNPDANQQYYEKLDYADIEYPFYEAFIIRETNDNPISANNFYNIWSEDCQDCGHITNQCGGGHNTKPEDKRILIENPLRQSFDVGDLAFTVDTGRKQRVNTGSYEGGDGQGAAGRIVTDSSGNASFQVISAGSDYSTGGFGIVSSGCKICTNLTLQFEAGSLSSGILEPSGGFPANSSCNVTVYPNNANVQTELFPIHWVIQAEFKSQQVVTHVECDNGILQTCTMKLQTQGYKTCEWCGEDTAFINN